MSIAFWLLVAFVVFAFAGFPIVVVILGALLNRRYVEGPVTPYVTVLIAAYNESDGIARKVRNALEQRYPPDRLDVVVVDDGSTDETAARVLELRDRRVTLVVSPERGGKIAALNRGLPSVRGEIVLFTDANAEFLPDAVAELVRPFADPDVGGVSGNQLNRRGRGGLALGERLYWEHDKLIKRMESRTGSIVAADGSIYALRREFVAPVPAGVTDDFYLSTGVIAGLKRLVYNDRARSIEEPLEGGGDHFRRRVRITQQALRSLALRRALMNPSRHGVYAFVLVGHKLLRRLASPAILILLPVSAALAGEGTIYVLAFAAQLGLYGAALAGVLVRGRLGRALGAATYFVLGNVATSVGIVRFLAGQRSLMWEPVRR